jgi:hypothetical protein
METPKGQEIFPPDKWFQDQMLIVRTSKTHLQKSSDVLPVLTFTAGDRAVSAMRDYNVYELALAFTSHYGWQLVNGAKILPCLGELAKVYAGIYAVYLFKLRSEKAIALKAVNDRQRV